MVRTVRLAALACLLFIGACAQVPRESVELSATVGRDLAEMRRAHIELIRLYYDRQLTDIDQFIDQVYVPFQVEQTLADPVIRQELLGAIDGGSSNDPTGVRQQEAVAKLQVFLEILNEEVETFRASKRAPVEAQRDMLLDRVSEGYDRIHYANAIVTGHLASVVRVHEAQADVLARLDAGDLRQRVSARASETSNQIAQLIIDSKAREANLDRIVRQFESILAQSP